MLDLTSDKGRLISAALGLAAEKPWERLTLADIAERAGTTLAALKTSFASKSEILAAFAGLVDDEMLRRAPRRTEGQAPRDALFEVIMSRFDILEPWKGALRSIAASGLPHPTQIGTLLTAQGWMLEAAGISAGGVDGGVRTLGLATVYGSVFQTWLADDDPGLARTMAALDRRLRRGQRILDQAESALAGVSRVATAVAEAVKGGAKRATDAPAAAATPGAAAPNPVPPQM